MVVSPDGARDTGSSRRATVARCAVTIRDHDRAPVATVARLTGLSRPTVEAAVAELVTRGLVSESGPRTTGGRGAGRPARRYAFQSDAGALIGLDVGPHAVRVAVADLAGRVIGGIHHVTDGSFHGPGRMECIKRLVREALTRAGARVDSVVAMSVAVPGWVGRDGRLIVSRNMPDWEGVDIGHHLGAEFRCPVSVDNDMHFAALAEHRLGAARLAEDVIYLFAGHRLSMAVIIGGTVRRGSHGAAGEVGDIIFSRHANTSGELEWSSAASGELVFEQAARGDIDAQREVAEFVDGLAVGLATTIMAIDPDLVVIGGGLSGAGDTLLAPLRAAVNAAITVPVRPSMVASELGAESAVLGALAQACRRSTTILFGVDGLAEPSIELPAELSAGAGLSAVEPMQGGPATSDITGRRAAGA